MIVVAIDSDHLWPCRGDGVAQLVEHRTQDSMTRGSNPIRSTTKTQTKKTQFFPSQKCCADSLSVCPTQCVYATHKNDHVRTLKKDSREEGALKYPQQRKTCSIRVWHWRLLEGLVFSCSHQPASQYWRPSTYFVVHHLVPGAIILSPTVTLTQSLAENSDCFSWIRLQQPQEQSNYPVLPVYAKLRQCFQGSDGSGLRMTTNDTMEVQFGLRLLDRTVDPRLLPIYKYPSVVQALELGVDRVILTTTFAVRI